MLSKLYVAFGDSKSIILEDDDKRRSKNQSMLDIMGGTEMSSASTAPLSEGSRSRVVHTANMAFKKEVKEAC